MAERDREYFYWKEQNQRERDRLLSRDDQQQGWQARPESQQRSWENGRESQWSQRGPERDYDARRSYGDRDYGGQRGHQADYGGYRGQQADYGSGYRSQTSFRGDQQSGYGGYGPSGEAQTGYGRSAGQSDYTGYGTQTGYGREWQTGGDSGQRSRTLGRGPKGYKRSDDRIREDVCERLIQSDLDVSDVSVVVRDGTVTLEGTVPERRTKHRIEDIAEQCFGVSDVDNRIRVSRSDSDRSWTDRRESEVDGLNRCIRSELSAIETYRQALDRDRNQFGAQAEFQRLSEILREHEDAAARLRQAIQRSGGEPSTDSGAWGTWSKIIMGAAKLFGDKAALKALKEGEESGLEEYQRFQRNSTSAPEVYDLTSEFMARQRRHIRELDSLMAAVDRR